MHKELVAVAAPVFTYTAFSSAPYAYTISLAPVVSKANVAAPANAHVAYAYAIPYFYTIPYTGCLNNKGSVVPCAP